MKQTEDKTSSVLGSSQALPEDPRLFRHGEGGAVYMIDYRAPMTRCFNTSCAAFCATVNCRLLTPRGSPTCPVIVSAFAAAIRPASHSASRPRPP